LRAVYDAITIGPVDLRLMARSSMREISLERIRDAASAVYETAVRTPLVRLDLPTAEPRRVAGFDRPLEVYLKLEALQPIGSFKIRGAYNLIRQLPPSETRQGVWTVSAGNAAQGVALAAWKVSAPCSVMVMDTAPEAKLSAIRAHSTHLADQTEGTMAAEREYLESFVKSEEVFWPIKP